jgi:hypothetical protein
VAPITGIHQNTASNERRNESKLVLLALKISNNTSLSHSASKSPTIDTESTPSNVSAVLGEHAYLVCSVMNLGENVVSWLRHKDTNLLSVGKDKYTQDPRYQVFHDEDADTWTMKVRVKLSASNRSSKANEAQLIESSPLAFAD